VFVVDDFDSMPVAKVFHERGAWPPPLGSVLVERSGLSVLEGDIGARFWLRLPGLGARQVRVSGIAHEPALAPAQTEQAIYAYVSAETTRDLGVSPTFDELRVLFPDSYDRPAVENAVRDLADYIEHAGLAELGELRVPPPRHHPHQTQMTAVLVVLLVFTLLVLLMSGFLAASLIATLMARQVREIGIMKALGATTRRLSWMYSLLVLALGGAAVIVAWFPGQLGSHAFTSSVARLLNFDITSYSEPLWVVLVKLGVGALVPALLLLPTVWRAARVSVRQALDEHGVAQQGFGQQGLERWALRGQSRSAPLAYAFRNMVRQRRQLVLSLALLGAAGGAFVTAVSVAKAWDALTAQLVDTRHYDVEVRFDSSVNLEPLAEQIRTLPAVGAVEAWRSVPTVVSQPGQRPIANTYPDDSHGAFHLVAPPNGARMLDVELSAGRWLTPDDERSVVINQMVPGYDRLRPGDTLTLSVAGKPRELSIVGKTSQVGAGAVAYISAKTFDGIVPKDRRQGKLWVRRAAGSTSALPTSALPTSALSTSALSTSALQSAIEQRLDAAGAPLESVLPLSVFKNALVAHFELLMKTLLGLAALTAVVGALSLGSAMSIAVLARTRELAVLRAVGATGRQLQRTILIEALLVAAVSLAAAAGFGGTLALVVGRTIGELSFKLPLPWTFSGSALAVWGVGVLMLTLLATWGPARRAARLSVREALNAV
jgi:putative ABC transport system permease protein